MKSLALLTLAFTAALATTVVPADPFLEEIAFGAVADAVRPAMTDAGYTLVESSDKFIIGVRGDESLEYRFSGGSQVFAEYTLRGLSPAALGEKLDAWTERLQRVWGDPAAVSVDGSKLWIVTGMYTIALHAEGNDLLVTVTWD
jgi:hypothetical protein